MIKVKEFGISLIRTSIIPPLAGYLLTKLPIFDRKSIELVLTVLLGGLWYMVFHGIEVLSTNEKIKKWAGIFLGFPAQPKYIIKETTK